MRRTAGLVLLGVLLAGCGASTGSASTEPSAGTPSAVLPTTTTQPSATPTDPPKGSSVKLTGTPQPGVEAGCILLQGYLLIGGDRTLLASGVNVDVVGTVPVEQVMSICQQGTALMVQSVAAAS